MLKTNAPKPQALERVCIRCGDSNLITLTLCSVCGFDLTSDLQRDYDFYRDGIPFDRPSGVGERQAAAQALLQRSETHPGFGQVTRAEIERTTACSPHGPVGEDTRATMDLGAAVLESVYAPSTQTSGRVHERTEDMDALDRFDIDVDEGASLDPVGWSPSKAMHIEAPVVVTQGPPNAYKSSGSRHGDESIQGVVEAWAGPLLFSDPRRAELASKSGSAGLSSQEALQPGRDPLSRRNHIRQGATTYVDTVQSSVRIGQTGWWHQDAALPCAIAVGIVTLVLFALM